MGCGATNPKDIDNSMFQTVLTLNKIYQRKQLIGSGTYGKVYRCINKLNGQQYALKVVEITAKNKQQAIKQINNLKTQISVLKRLNHQNIIKYYSFDISEDNKSVQIVLQYAKKGSLKDYIKQKGFLQQKQASEKCSQILQGLKYLHQMNIVHRDLKCANILISEDGILKISDFGTAKHIKINTNQDIAKLCSSLKGTPYFMAPQVLKRTGHNSSADIWSIGCLVIEMLSGKAPWTSLTSSFQEIISYIVSGIHPPFPKNISEQCKCFLQSCLDSMPRLRLNAAQLKKHRWIQKYNIFKTIESNQDYVEYFKKVQKIKNSYNLQEKMVQKVKQKQQKYNEIQKYIQNKLLKKTKQDSQVKKKQSKRQSAKSKKQKILFSRLSTQNIYNQIDEIQIQPHLYNESRMPQSKKRPNNDEKHKISQTAPFVKMSQDNILNKKEYELELQLTNHQRVTAINQTPKHEIYGKLIVEEQQKNKQIIIDTLISREQRNRYLQRQKIFRQQKQQQKRKWQQQLKQGANYIRKQITGRYNI